MTHGEFRRQLDARLDGELNDAEATAFDAHVETCAECRAEMERRMAVSDALVRGMPSYVAPAELRDMLVRAAREQQGDASAPPPAPPHIRGEGSVAPIQGGRSRRVQWLAMAASLVIVAGGSWQLSANHARGQLMSEVVLESHVRSLLGEHLTDVTSTDQHTVKPWFNGKIAFSPPVYDFAGRGYPLLGGRLEYLGGQQVAALVYERRKHLINVFLWPTSDGNTGGPARKAMNGYHMLHMTQRDFTYWIVSDLGSKELDEFSGLLMGADTAVAM